MANFPDIKIPVVNIKTNPLDALLATLGLRFYQLSKTNQAFAKLLSGRKFCIQLASGDGVIRHYNVNHGKFSQHFGYATKPDLSLKFVDGMTGVRILSQGDPSVFMTAIQAGKLQVDGDYSLLMWFAQAGGFALPGLPKAIKPYVKKIKPYLKKPGKKPSAKSSINA